MATPLISVIIPTYNGFERLKRTVQSVLAQTYTSFEVIVIDDGSTDETPEITQLFEGLIQYIRVANGGQQRARNHGVTLSKGQWLSFLDHDDLWEPDYLQEVSNLATRQDVDVVLSNSKTWQENESGGYWKDKARFTQFAPVGYWSKMGIKTDQPISILERYDYRSYLEFHPSQTSMFSIRRTLFDSLHGFDPRMRGSGAENFEFEMRALRVARVGLLWHPLVTMVRHERNASLDGSRMTMDSVACFQFALSHHDLNEGEKAIVQDIIQQRIPAAIDGAFTLGEFESLVKYRQMFSGLLSLKRRIKCGIAKLPRPIATLTARTLQRG